MAWNGHVVIDSDSHVYERADRTYQGYVDPEYQEPYDRLCKAIGKQLAEGRTYALFGTRESILDPFDSGRPMGVPDTFGLTPQRGGGSPQDAAEAASEGKLLPREEVSWDAPARLEAMDRAMIDINLMFPTHASSYCCIRDVGFESALYRAYHRFVSDFCAQAPRRLKWNALVNQRDLPAGLAEVESWAKRDPNLIGIYLPPIGTDGRLLDSPDFYPLYSLAQDLDLPLTVHIGVPRPPYTPGMLDMDGRGFLLSSLAPGFAGMGALGSFLGGGIFDLFPKLRVGIFETHAGWLPFAVEQFEWSSGRRAFVPHMKRSPREILASGQLFHGITTGEESLRFAMEEFGEDIWLFTTDFPHRGSPWPNGVQETVDPTWMTDSGRRKVLGENALRFFKRIEA